MMPFEGGIEGTSNATLLIAVAAGCLAAFLGNARATWLKSIVSGLTGVALALLTALESGPVLVAVAAMLAAVSGVLLSRGLDVAIDRAVQVLALAHFVLAVQFYLAGPGYEIALTSFWFDVLAGTVALLVLVAAAYAMGLSSGRGRLGIALLGMASALLLAATIATGSIVVVLGSLCLTVAAAFLAAEEYTMPAISPHREWMKIASILLQGAGFVMIVLASL